MMRLSTTALCVLLASGLLNAAAPSAVSAKPPQPDAQEEKDTFGQHCYALPREVWNKVLGCLLGPDQRVWYCVDCKSLPPWKDGSECALDNGGRIIMHDQKSVYTWHPHKNAWNPADKSGNSGTFHRVRPDWRCIKVSPDTVTLANHKTKHLQMLDALTLQPSADYVLDPTLAYVTSARRGMCIVSGAHPAIMKDRMRMLTVTTAGAPGKPAALEQKIMLPDGVMPPMVMDAQGRYVVGLDPLSDSVVVCDAKESKVTHTIALSDRSLSKATQALWTDAGQFAGHELNRAERCIRYWRLCTPHTLDGERTLMSAQLALYPDLMTVWTGGAYNNHDLYDHKNDVISMEVQPHVSKQDIHGLPFIDLHGLQQNLDDNRFIRLAHLALIGRDPLLLTLTTEGEGVARYCQPEPYAELTADLAERARNERTLSAVLWNIHEGKAVAHSMLTLEKNGIVASATSNTARLLCTHGDDFSLVDNVQADGQLAAMQWHPINFGARNCDAKSSAPYRRIHKLLMSPSGDWALMREKRVQAAKDIRKGFAEIDPAMLYLGLHNLQAQPLPKDVKAAETMSKARRTFAMRLYALQRESELGNAVTAPQKLQQTVRQQHNEQCVIS